VPQSVCCDSVGPRTRNRNEFWRRNAACISRNSVAPFFFILSQIGGIRALTMQNATHIAELVFEASALLTGFVYLACWSGGRKLTNRQALLVFAISFPVVLALNLLSSIVPTYVFLVVAASTWLLKPLRTLLNSKPASKIKVMFARKPSALPGKSDPRTISSRSRV